MIILVFFFAFILRLINLDQSFWLDEAAQYFESQAPLTKQWYLPATFHPPLFHYLTNFWVRFFDRNEVSLRLLPVSLSLFSIIVSYYLAKTIFPKKKLIPTLTAALLATSPLHLYYSQEFRPYILSVLIAEVSTLYFVKFINSKKNISLGYIITSVLSLYALYSLVFLILSQFFTTLFLYRKKIISLFKNQLIIVIFFVPWLPFLFVQLKNGIALVSDLPGWGNAVSTPLLKSFPLIFIKFCLGPIRPTSNANYFFLSLLLFFFFCLLTIKVYQSKNRKNFSWLIFNLGLPLLLAAVVSLYVPIISPKRMLFLLPLFYLLISLGINSIKTRKLKSAAIILVLSFNLSSLVTYYQNPRFQRENWKDAVKEVEEKSTPQTLIVFNFPEPFAPFRFYESQKNDTFGVVKNFQFDQESTKILISKTQNKNHVFLFDYLSGLTDAQRKSKKTLENLGFINIQTYDFNGVGFIFEFIKINSAQK